MKIKLYSSLLILILFVSACAVKKPVSSIKGATVLSKNQTRQFLTNLKTSRLDFKTFQGKAKTKVGLNNRSFNTNAVIRIEHNRAIWISFTSILSMEIARVMITPTKVQIINRLNRSYIDQPFDFIYKYASTDINFQELEALIIGNTLSFTTNPDNLIFSTQNGYQLTGTKQSLNFEMLFNQDTSLRSNMLQDSVRNQAVKIDYSQFKTHDGSLIPHFVNIKVSSPKQALTASLDYNTIRIDEDVSIPFSIPDSYKRIDAR